MRRVEKIFGLVLGAAACVFAVPGQAQQLYYEQQAKLIADDVALADFFGWTVAIEGEVAVVGSIGDDQRRGSAYVFRRNGTDWTQEQKLTASDASPDDAFGSAVGVSGDTIVIGAGEDSPAGHNSGAAYIFSTTGEGWVETQYITPSDLIMDDKFGESLSISGDRFVVGSRFHDDFFIDSGSIYVFVKDATQWVEETKLNPSLPLGGAAFGTDVHLKGDHLISGAPLGAGSPGRAFVFIRSATEWNEVGVLEPSDGVAGDNFGRGVTIDGDTAAVGAPLASPQGTSSGAVYIYSDDGSGWAETQKLTAPDGGPNEQFGVSVAMDGDTLLVGADLKANPNANSGAVYVYVHNGSEWVFEAKWFVEDVSNNQSLGRVVRLSGDTAISGAIGDAEAGFLTGASYIFSRTSLQIPGVEPDMHVEGWTRY